MRLLHLDLFSGIAGDMFLGALVDVGFEETRLRAELAKLGVEGFDLRIERVWREGFAGVRVEVETTEERPPERRLADVQAVLAGSGLSPRVKELAGAVFTRLAEAEAKVHGTTPEEVHFHEVGALDAMVDIVGVCAGLEALGVDEVHASEVTLGRGTVSCQHGRMPVPVPATLELLRDVPVRFTDLEGELVTPTGAALLSTLAAKVGAGFSFVPRAIGYGFGRRQREEGPPNALRILLGEFEDRDECLVLLETNLDDVSGQVVGHLLARVLDSGALDAWATPVQMKKSRPGMVFSVLVDEAGADRAERIVYEETRTLGVRRTRVSRTKLARREERVQTSLGDVRVKIARGPGGFVRREPEADDVARIARERGLSFVAVLEALRRELPVVEDDSGGAAGGGA